MEKVTKYNLRFNRNGLPKSEITYECPNCGYVSFRVIKCPVCGEMLVERKGVVTG